MKRFAYVAGAALVLSGCDNLINPAAFLQSKPVREAEEGVPFSWQYDGVGPDGSAAFYIPLTKPAWLDFSVLSFAASSA